VSRRVTYVTEKQRDGLNKRERARLNALKPVVQAAMDQAALERTLAAGQKLVDAERQQADELLASARNAFPELRGRQADRATPPVRPAAPRTRRAGWYRRVNGAPVVKDAGRARMPLWQNYVPPDRGDPGQHFISDLESGPAPFPAGLNVRD
jgi:hypothetical protein